MLMSPCTSQENSQKIKAGDIVKKDIFCFISKFTKEEPIVKYFSLSSKNRETTECPDANCFKSKPPMLNTLMEHLLGMVWGCKESMREPDPTG